MMIPAQIDLENSKLLMKLVDSTVTEIMANERKRLRKSLVRLVERNMELGGSKDAYLLHGEVYTHFPQAVIRHNVLAPIHESLQAEAEDFRDRYAVLDRDTRRIRQSLAVIVPRCQTPQHLRDALPESLSSRITEFRGMSREHHEGFILDSSPLLKAQFEEVMDLAILYMVNDLIF